ncbi:retrovirus-related pol polyprotein from transposon TNT 1-94 [Tanacetum coccineum]
MGCDVSWKSRLSMLNDENALLKIQVDSIVKERENIKLEYKKLFNSIKATQTQHQNKLDELIEHVNQKTYAYAKVRSQNQDLLMIISELKNKLKTIKKGKNVNTKFDKSDTSRTLLLVTPLPKNIAVKAKKVSNTKVNADRIKRALFTTLIAAKSKNLGATSVVAISRLNVVKTQTATNKVSSRNVTPDLFQQLGRNVTPDPFQQLELLIESISIDLECFDDDFETKAKNGSTNLWKKAEESQFPVLSRMARDILSVQATSVASESAFSTSERVLSIRRTRLTPASLEMCMCLKDPLDATDRIQHTSNLENFLDFEETILDEQVLTNEAISLSDKKIALDEATNEARSNGSGDEIEITSY